jgi:CBS domain-containing protein
MLHHHISHICLTEDGTDKSKVTGILSEHDLLSSRGNHPAAVIKDIKRATDVPELKKISSQTELLLNNLLDQNIPVDFVLKVIALINQALHAKIIEFSLAGMDGPPPANFTWLALGSLGRNEQLLISDQDHALIYSDVPKADQEKTSQYFLQLAKMVTVKLETLGFEYCTAEMMASNPKWCLSLSAWKEQFRDWITNPDEEKILLCNIFFDFRGIFGNPDLPVQLEKCIVEYIESHEIFLNRLALNAVKNPPPLSFFRQFLLEHSGEHKDQFDIKARAIMPLVDAARVLILSNRITGISNTLERFEKLIALEPQNKDIYIMCLESYKILLRFRAKQGLANHDSGRFVHIKSLNKFERLQLRNCFKPIAEVQELIKVRFNLAQLL